MSTPFLGQITVFPYNFAPYGWMDCAGQILPISQYAALFSLLGTQYGGNGTSNFALPDLQGRIPVGQGQLLGGGIYDMGEEAGSENVTLLTTTMSAHTHSLTAATNQAASNNPSGQLLSKPEAGGGHGGASAGNIYNPGNVDTPLAPTSIGTAGGSQPHNNIQPTLVLRYCIAMQGVFPARS
ncbi:phage tail protein [Acidisphaera sp. S103]|uniref:phage tail protein n=1 Tax=Acidisphaera sp. S103 TaxID=1747223 RepID=UPI00131B5B41|nr:tail fiber protein [Acidisphaera sp. S103]